jgi:hypothetical protein
MAGSGLARRTRGLWFGLLGGPLAWVLEMFLVYYTSGNCSARTTLLIAGTIVAALVAIAAGAVSWRISQEAEQAGTALAGRVEFYATGGIYISILSLLVVLMVLLTAVILGSSCG